MKKVAKIIINITIVFLTMRILDLLNDIIVPFNIFRIVTIYCMFLIIYKIPFRRIWNLINGIREKRVVLIPLNTRNIHGRIYKQSDVSKHLESLNKIGSEGKLIGEVGHPSDSLVSLSNASHLIKDLEITEDGLVGTVRLLNTELGRNINFEEYVFRPRSLGGTNCWGCNVDNNGVVTLVEILTFDAIKKESDSWNN
jgi:hypothetical protein